LRYSNLKKVLEKWKKIFNYVVPCHSLGNSANEGLFAVSFHYTNGICKYGKLYLGIRIIGLLKDRLFVVFRPHRIVTKVKVIFLKEKKT